MGKGSKPRPFSVDQDTFSSNWDLIFGKNQKVKQAIVTELNWDGDAEGVINTTTQEVVDDGKSEETEGTEAT